MRRLPEYRPGKPKNSAWISERQGFGYFPMMYDLAIIGLGPAGSTLARLLGGSLKIAAIDRKKLDGSAGGFEKPCGGLLAPSAQKALVRQGLNLPSSLLVDPQIFAVKTMDLHSGMTRLYQRYYMNINRHKFDLWLASLIPPAVKIFDQSECRRIIPRPDGGYDLNFTQGGRKWTISARRVVGADGSGSLVRRVLGPRPIRRYICIQETFPGHPREMYGCFFDERITDCYGWINNKNGQLVLGAALPLHKEAEGKRPRERFEAAKEALRPFGYRFYGAPMAVEAALVSRPSSIQQIVSGAGDLFLIGEAAGLVSPSSLEGISYALLSAGSLARVINGGSKQPQRDYRRALKPLKRKIALRLLKSPFMYRPLLRRLVMLSGLESVTLDSISQFE